MIDPTLNIRRGGFLPSPFMPLLFGFLFLFFPWCKDGYEYDNHEQ
jgi:hypothetical protein